MQFKVKVTIMAAVEYETTVEAPNEAKAEDEACLEWREKTPADFAVDKGYITEWHAEAEQTSWECVECEAAISEADHRRYDELCSRCFTRTAIGVAS